MEIGLYSYIVTIIWTIKYTKIRAADRADYEAIFFPCIPTEQKDLGSFKSELNAFQLPLHALYTPTYVEQSTNQVLNYPHVGYLSRASRNQPCNCRKSNFERRDPKDPLSLKRDPTLSPPHLLPPKWSRFFPREIVYCTSDDADR